MGPRLVVAVGLVDVVVVVIIIVVVVFGSVVAVVVATLFPGLGF